MHNLPGEFSSVDCSAGRWRCARTRVWNSYCCLTFAPAGKLSNSPAVKVYPYLAGGMYKAASHDFPERQIFLLSKAEKSGEAHCDVLTFSGCFFPSDLAHLTSLLDQHRLFQCNQTRQDCSFWNLSIGVCLGCGWIAFCSVRWDVQCGCSSAAWLLKDKTHVCGLTYGAKLVHNLCRRPIRRKQNKPFGLLSQFFFIVSYCACLLQ